MWYNKMLNELMILSLLAHNLNGDTVIDTKDKVPFTKKPPLLKKSKKAKQQPIK